MKFFPIFLPFFPPAGDFYGFSAVALARFALIRRWRATFPLEGEGFVRSSIFFMFYLSIGAINRRCT